MTDTNKFVTAEAIGMRQLAGRGELVVEAGVDVLIVEDVRNSIHRGRPGSREITGNDWWPVSGPGQFSLPD